MAGLKDVNYSLQGEQKQKQEKQIVEDSIISEINIGNETLANAKYFVFKLVNSNRKGGVYLPNIDDVFNPETKKVERMRLISGVPSVWLKDQKDLSPEYVRQNGREIKFLRGQRLIQVPEYDETLLTFLRLSSHNIGSKSKKMGSPYEFYEYDAAKEEQKAFEKEDFELEMAIMAKNAPVEDMKKHSLFLGILPNNEYGLPKGEDGIRREYIRAAKSNPAYFKETVGSKQMELNWLIVKAISENLIEINKEPGKIYWANGGGIICSVPSQTQPNKYLVDLAMTNSEDGKRFLEQLQKTVK